MFFLLADCFLISFSAFELCDCVLIQRCVEELRFVVGLESCKSACSTPSGDSQGGYLELSSHLATGKQTRLTQPLAPALESRLLAKPSDDAEVEHSAIARSKTTSVETLDDFLVRVLIQQAIDLFDDFRFSSGKNTERQR